MPVNTALRNLAKDGRFSLDDAVVVQQLVRQGTLSQAEAKETLTRYGDVMDDGAGQLLEGFTGGARSGAMTSLGASTLGGRALAKGMRGDDVMALQRGLMALSMRDRSASYALAARK